ncbi:MAG: carbon monoxide dehydrogenase [Nitrospirae bacterium]|nr:carbon monoxide dehydrogenase [Nitrospirota bacterium]
MEIEYKNYRVESGPEAFLPPAAACVGITLPDPGEGHVHGVIVSEDIALEAAAKALLQANVPTIFPGPLILWEWNDHVADKAKTLRQLYEELKVYKPTALLIPMPDYRPKYPKINPEVEINPNHPNLTIWHNKIDACIFIGVHCHQANLSLKIIRGGTNCFTIALCAQAGHEDAMVSVRDNDVQQINKLRAILKKVANSPEFAGKLGKKASS